MAGDLRTLQTAAFARSNFNRWDLKVCTSCLLYTWRSSHIQTNLTHLWIELHLYVKIIHRLVVARIFEKCCVLYTRRHMPPTGYC